RGEALAGQFALGDSPELGDEPAMFRLGDVAAAGKLVASLAMFAPALAVALAGQGTVTAARSPNAARRQPQVNVAQDILDALRVMLDTTRVEQHRGLSRPPNFRRLYDVARRNARDAFGERRRVFFDEVPYSVEVMRVVRDECFIDAAVLDHH